MGGTIGMESQAFLPGAVQTLLSQEAEVRTGPGLVLAYGGYLLDDD